MRPFATMSVATAACLGAAVMATPLGAAANAGERELAPLHAVASESRIEGSYIVMLKEQGEGMSASAVSAAADRAAGAGADVTHRYDAVGGYAATMSEGQLEKVRKDPAVAYVEQDGVVKASEEQGDATWGIDRIDQRELPLDQTYTYDRTGEGVTAYVIDTGLNGSHSEFAGRVGEGYDTVGDGAGTEDCNGHGTHVAGTVAGETYGVAKKAGIVPVRVLNCEGSGSNSGVIEGMDWVAQNAKAPAVANMSLGGKAVQSTDDAIARLTEAGVTVAVAAGNDSDDACNYSPARAESAITVASSQNDDARSSFSNVGDCTDIFAPGSDITSAWIDGGDATNTISGTSMASPHVAGAAALVLEEKPEATPEEVTTALLEQATPDVISDDQGSPNKLLHVGAAE